MALSLVRRQFSQGGPIRTDPLVLASIRQWLQTLRVWSSKVSGESQCLDIWRPVDAKPRIDAGDPAAPILWLGALLREAGWCVTREPVTHTDGTMVYCSRNFYQKRFYFQCLLRLEDPRKRGLRSMYSEELQSYYRCLLHGHLVPGGRSESAYKDVRQGKISASDLREEPEEAPRNLDAEALEDTVVLQSDVAFHEALMTPSSLQLLRQHASPVETRM